MGKNLMFHPVSVVLGIFDEPMEGFKGPLACSFFSHEFYETDLSRGFVRGYGFQGTRGVALASSTMGFLSGDKPIPWGRDHRKNAEALCGHVTGFSVLSDDLPEEHNRVTLDPELTDSHGIPAPKITYTRPLPELYSGSASTRS